MASKKLDLVPLDLEPVQSKLDLEPLDLEPIEAGPMITGKGLLEGAIQSLPAAGAMLGGAAGFASPVPGGLLTGSALGGAGGAALKGLLESALLDKPRSYTDLALDPLIGAGEGMAGEMGGQMASKALSKLAATIPTIGYRPGAEKVIKAGQRLGIKPTPGMLSESPVIQGLESSLHQSPTFGGWLARRETIPAQKAIQGQTENLLKEASSLSPYEAGSKIQAGLVQKIGEEVGPINMVYDDITEHTVHMGLNPKGQERIANNIRKISEVELLPNSPGAKMANQYADAVQNSKNVKQLGLLNSQAKAVMRDPMIGAADKNIMSQVIDKIDRYENNSIMRNAIEAARTKGQGAKIAKESVQQLNDARKAYKTFVTKYQKLGKGSKITTGKYGASNIVREIESVPVEKLPDKLFTTQNNDFLNYLKSEFPEQYAVAKEQKLAQLLKKSTGPDGEVSPKKFMQSIKNLGPEVRGHLFGEHANKVDDLLTIIQSIPQKIGPSGTPQGLEFLEMLNPISQATALGRYGLMKGLPFTKGAVESVSGEGTKGLIKMGTTRGLQK